LREAALLTEEADRKREEAKMKIERLLINLSKAERRADNSERQVMNASYLMINDLITFMSQASELETLLMRRGSALSAGFGGKEAAAKREANLRKKMAKLQVIN